MGLCCCKPKKYSKLESAAKLTKTSNNEDITKLVLDALTTTDQRESVINDKKLPFDYKTILTPPFSNFDQITSSVFLTGTGGMVKENIIRFRITCILNVTFEAPNYQIKGIECIRIPVDDTPEDDLYYYFDDVSDKLHEVTSKNGRAVVHCVAGVSRSTTFVLAYLMKYKKMRLKSAFFYVRERRSVAKPKPAFFVQLLRFEKKLFRKNSFQMKIYSKSGLSIFVPDFYITECLDLLNQEILYHKEGEVMKEGLIGELSERSVL